MSLLNRRTVLRVTLLIALIGSSLVAYRAWQISQPDYHWQRAQAALDAGQDEPARIYLLKTIQRAPRHGVAHWELANLYLRTVRQENPQATYAHHKSALSHLATASNLMPKQAEIHDALMHALLSAGDRTSATHVARRVVQVDSTNATAWLLIAHRGLEQNAFDDTIAALDLLDAIEHAYTYQSQFLRAELFRIKNDPAPLAAIHATVVGQLSKAAPQELSALSAKEYRSARNLILAAVRNAATPEDTLARATTAMAVLESHEDAKSIPQLGYLSRAAASALPLEGEIQQNAQTLSAKIDAACRKAIVSGSTDAVVYHLVALRDRDHGQIEQAIATLAQGIEQCGHESAAEQKIWQHLHLLRSQLLMESQQFATAKQHIEPLMANAETRGNAQLLAGSIAMGEGRIAKAAEHFQAASDLVGGTLQIHLAQAICAEGLGQWNQVAKHLKAVFDHTEHRTPAEHQWIAKYFGSVNQLHRLQAKALLVIGQVAEAQVHLQALQGTNLEPRGHALVADFHWRHGRSQRSLETLATARSRFPNDVGLTLAHASALRKVNQTEAATKLVAEFIAADPEALPRQLAGVQWQLWTGNAQDALAALTVIREANPNARTLPLLEAQIHLMTNQPQFALALSKKMDADSEKTTVDPLASKLIGIEAALRLGKLDEVSQILSEEGGMENSLGWKQIFQARALLAQHQHEQAIRTLAATLEYNSVSTMARTLLLGTIAADAASRGPLATFETVSDLLQPHAGQEVLIFAHAMLAMQTGQPAVAVADWKSLQANYPDSPVIAFQLARAHRERHDHSAALRAVKHAIALNSKFADAQILTAELSLHTKQPEVAVAHATSAMRLAPNDPRGYLLGAAAHLQQQQLTQAAVTLERLLVRVPNSQAGYLMLIQIYHDADQPELALRFARRGHQQIPENFTFVEQQIRLLAPLDREDAIRTLADQVAGEQPTFEICDRLAWTMLSAGVFEEASRWADTAMAVAIPAQQARVNWLLGNIAMIRSRGAEDREMLVEARQQFMQVLSADANHFGAANNLAYLLATEFDDPQAALAIANRVREQTSLEKVEPAFVDTMVTIYRKLDRLAELQVELKAAAEQQPTASHLQYHLGRVQVDLGQDDTARQTLLRAINLGLSERHQIEAQDLLKAIDVPSSQES